MAAINDARRRAVSPPLYHATTTDETVARNGATKGHELSNGTMRTWELVVLLALLPLAVADADATVDAGQSRLKENARNYLRAIEQHHGRISSADIENKFVRRATQLEEAEKVMGKEQVDIVRNFVREVGPWLGKLEYSQHVPLHEVLIRADDLLGIEDEPDQDLHPYRKTKKLISAMREFTAAVISDARREKDEL